MRPRRQVSMPRRRAIEDRHSREGSYDRQIRVVEAGSTRWRPDLAVGARRRCVKGAVCGGEGVVEV